MEIYLLILRTANLILEHLQIKRSIISFFGRLKKPCKECIPAYSFKNHLSLKSGAASDFKNQVAKASLSGNIDVPEGGLDALVQAIVCEEEIGWRNDSSRIIVFSTDADYHVAGDGKLAGIVEPMDDKCRLKNNMYEDDLLYDYPSMGSVLKLIQDKHVNVLFAVDKSVSDVYRVLSDQLLYSELVDISNATEDIKSTILTFYKVFDHYESLLSNKSIK